MSQPTIRNAAIGDVTLTWAESGAGSPLLLVHGFPFTHDLWTEQLVSPPQGWRLIAPDLRGFGGSSQGGQDTYRMELFASDMFALLDHLDVGRAAVCGLSMGGYVTLAMVRREPRRIAGLILSDTRATPDGADAQRARADVARRARGGEAEAVVEEMVPRLLAAESLRKRPDVVDRLGTMMRASPAETIARASLGMAERRDMRPLLGVIDVPTLIIVGEEDAVTPQADAESMAAAIPGARLEVVAGAGHLPCMEQPAEFNRLLAGFLHDIPAV